MGGERPTLAAPTTGRNGEGSVWRHQKPFKTTKESLLSGVKHFLCRHLRITPYCGGIGGEGIPGSPGVHRQAKPRWTHGGTYLMVQNGGGEYLPSFWTLY